MVNIDVQVSSVPQFIFSGHPLVELISLKSK